MEKERKRKKREEHELSRYSPSAESESIPRRRRPTRVPNMSLRSMHSAVSVIVVQSLPRFCKSDSERNGDGEKTRSRKNILPNATFPPIYFERERESERVLRIFTGESLVGREGRRHAQFLFLVVARWKRHRAFRRSRTHPVSQLRGRLRWGKGKRLSLSRLEKNFEFSNFIPVEKWKKERRLSILRYGKERNWRGEKGKKKFLESIRRIRSNSFTSDFSRKRYGEARKNLSGRKSLTSRTSPREVSRGCFVDLAWKKSSGSTFTNFIRLFFSLSLFLVRGTPAGGGGGGGGGCSRNEILMHTLN